MGELGPKRSVARRPATGGTGVHRGPPGRRSVDDRTETVVELLSGKTTPPMAGLAFRFGVHPKTVEKWREVALEGIEGAMRQGSGKTKREKELERKLRGLERAFTNLAIRHELVERALAERPTRPGRSSR